MTDQGTTSWTIDEDRDLFTIRSDRLLIVEGDFDWGFLRALLDRHSRRRVQIGIIQGKTRYAARVLTRIRTDEADQLRWLGLARDADSEQDNPFASMVGAMRRIRAEKPWFSIPERAWERSLGDEGRSASLFVFPPDESTGDIERWIWSALIDQPVASCVEAYIDCLAGLGRTLQRPWKARVYAYLAALSRPDMPLKAAARAVELPLDAPAFQAFLELVPHDDEVL